MLKILSCAQPEAKRSLFADFDASGGAWVVSDLQSKWHLQKELLRREGVLEQACVWRATELWRHFAFQLQPDVRLLSPELAQTLFWNWIEPMGLPWAKSPQAVPVVLNQMQMWMSLFSDPQHEEIMPQWFQANPESYVRWGHWFELCAEIWRRCQSEGLVMVNWLPAVLLSQDLSALVWERELTFDLGPQISQVEGQLIKELSRHFEVNLIFPEAPWVSLMKNTLRPYDDLLAQPYKGDPEWQPSVSSALEFGRFSTQLAEVKDAVGRVRAWLDSGVQPQQIAVVAPDIEEYWPALQMYAQQEGIAFCKPVTARLGSFLEMARWISTLRTALAKVSAADLEMFLFSMQDQPRLSFEDFRVLFTHVYDSYDLRRASYLFESAVTPLDAARTLRASEFLIWTLKFWSTAAPTQRLLALLQVIGQEVPPDLELLPHQWLSYFEGILARREQTLRPADENGVWCVSLSSADWLPVTHGVFLNLSEGALRSVENTPVSSGEAQKIYADTGYAVGTSDHQENEFELLWFLKREWNELRLCFAATDFEGRVLTPSKLWMWAAFTNEQLKHQPEAPRVTRWDEIQRQSPAQLAEVRRWDKVRQQGLETGLTRDTSIAVSTWKPSARERVSASSLERYWNCPFQFAAERKLKLSDAPALDLDLDRRTRGSLLHALAERLTEEPLRFDWSDEELGDLIERCRADEKIRLGDERMWPALKAQHTRLARYLLDFEQEWRRRFPNTKTVGRETGFECSWDLSTGAPGAAGGAVTLSGRLDRIDQDSKGRYALVDYKASSANLRNWKSWEANHDVQLALYSMLVEEGLTGLPAGPVTAANYYVIKESDRRKGFHLRDETSELYSSADRHYNFINEQEKSELFARLREQINGAVTALMEGRLNPEPESEKVCGSCSWRKLCRAPHLN
ncbi:MAG: PD-(D/E)XK nuclease family protein [Bdellovibrionales bacterium]|nr:PD-(D/E)XK nuclease family protein [Bdellovibrionales bacterium]